MFIKKNIVIDNQKIVYLDNEVPDKKIIMFVHGWGADKENLRAIYHPLNNLYRIIAIDLPGFGESPEPVGLPGSPEYADILYKFIKKLNIVKINYIGHSFGGKIGMVLSFNHIDVVEKLILIDSNGLKNRHSIVWYIKVGYYKLIKNIFLLIVKDNNKVEKLKSKFGSKDYQNAGNMRNILVKTVNEDFTDKIGEIKCPVFIYWGEKDKDTPLWMAKKLNKIIKDSGLYIVKNGGHFSFIDNPAIIEIIKSFI